jgi:hypothetical protein
MAATDASLRSETAGYGPVPRAYWLPPHGYGNGLDAPSWAPIADVTAKDVDVLLDALCEAQVPGYAAEVGPPGSRRRVRIWVASLCYSTAEDVLRTALQRLNPRGEGA